MSPIKKIFTYLSTLLLGLFIAVQADSATVQRSSFLVGNIACTSCLAAIETELKGAPGTLGMKADIRTGRVTVDHLSTLDCEQIAAVITGLGYPATVDWTATVPDRYTRKFAGRNNFNAGCTGGNCDISGTAGAGPAGWNAVPASGTISRTTLQVSNMTCTSCLASIADELRSMPGTYGMQGYLSRGVIIVDHAAAFDNSRLAAAITDLGYPARILALNEIPVQKAYSYSAKGEGGDKPDSQFAPGYSCSSKGPCNATSASWQKLYNRYFNRSASQ